MRENKVFGIIGIVLGAVICIFGFNVLSSVSGIKTSAGFLENTSFGGDFYSYEYKATRIAAENVEIVAKISEVLGTGIGLLLLAIGGTDILYFGSKLTRKPIQNLDRNGTTIVRIEASQSEELINGLKQLNNKKEDNQWKENNKREDLPFL